MAGPLSHHAHLLEPSPVDLTGLSDLLEPSIVFTRGPASALRPTTKTIICGRVTAELLAACPHLENIIIPFAGVPRTFRLLLANRHQIRVFNSHHNATATAETALALLLAAAKFVVPFDRALRAGDWRPRYGVQPVVRLGGKQAMILGYGAIGGRIGVMLQGLGMSVVGVRRKSVGRAGGAARIIGQHALHSELPATSVLMVCLPLTDETRGLVNADLLSQLGPNAIVVNIARGPVVAERDLYDSLVSGRIAAAGLDVWYRYPNSEAERTDCLPCNLPFHELSNVVFSPHRGGLDREVEAERSAEVAQIVGRLASGKAVQPVDLAAGY